MRRTCLIALLCSAAALISLCLPAPALAVLTPEATITSPANGSTIAGGQPTFSGTATDDPTVGTTVRVLVFSGSPPGGSPVQTLTTTRTGGTYSVGVSSPLSDGTYSAQAQEDDVVGNFGPSSAPVTFTIHNALPHITLDSPGSAPLLTATPTLTGTAGTAKGDNPGVSVLIYPGSDTSHAPVSTNSGPTGTGGRFTIRVSVALPDGQYTAVAVQSGLAGTGASAPQTFRIKTQAPALTIDQPAVGSGTKDAEPLFSGAAGNGLGDSSQVQLRLYSGGSTNGEPVGTVTITRSAASWSVRWPEPLSAGQYTAQAAQSDDVGHTGISAPDTFLVVPTPTVIGSSVKLSRSGSLSVSIGCGAPAGQVCKGTVLIVTVRKFRPLHRGPAGRLRVLFAYVSIPGARSTVVSRKVPKPLARVLRRAGKLKLLVSTALSSTGGSSATASAVRRLQRS